MSRPSIRHYLIGLSMIAAAAFSVLLVPSATSEMNTGPTLEQSLPQHFGAWTAVPSPFAFANLTTDETAANVARTYDQTVMRTYRKEDGTMVMLAVAWVKHQTQDAKVHRPELCYTAQGFQILAKNTTVTPVLEQTIPITRLVARSPQHVEPVTYWIRLGEHFSSSPFETRLHILKEGLQGSVPDGMLVRVSTIAQANNVDAAFATQQSFIEDLLNNLDHDGKRLMLGQTRIDKNNSLRSTL